MSIIPSVTTLGVSRRTSMPWRSAGAALALSLSFYGGPATAQETFKIGAVCSLSGPAAGFGKPYCDGFEAYVKTWNARGGAKGRKVELTIHDDETNPITGLNAFRRLAADPAIRLIWLAISSNSVMGIKALASEVKIPIISGGGADEIGLPANPYLFKVATGTTDFNIALLEWAKRQGVKRIASITASDTYGQSESSKMRALAPKYGIEVVAQETFGNTDTNFNTQLVRVRSAKPDLVFSGATGRPAILVYQQYRQLQLPFPLALTQGAFNRAFFDALGGPQAVEGVLSATNQGSLGDALSGEAGDAYRKASAALGRPAILFETFGWDHGILAEWAINNSDGGREGLRATLDRTKELPAINGPFNFTPDNHIGQDARGLRVTVYKGGKFVDATSLTK